MTKYRKDKNDTTTCPGFDFDAWKDKHAAFAAEAVPRWVRAVADQHGSLPAAGSGSGSGGRPPKFACVGYCFGAPYVCEQLARGGDGVVSAGAFAHPAFLKESHFRNLDSSCIPGFPLQTAKLFL